MTVRDNTNSATLDYAGKSALFKHLLAKQSAAAGLKAVRVAPHGSAATAMTDHGGQGKTYYKVMEMRPHDDRGPVYEDVGETAGGDDKGVLAELAAAKCIWADEAAATHPALLELLSEACQRADGSREVFGHKQVVLSCDILQLGALATGGPYGDIGKYGIRKDISDLISWGGGWEGGGGGGHEGKKSVRSPPPRELKPGSDCIYRGRGITFMETALLPRLAHSAKGLVYCEFMENHRFVDPDAGPPNRPAIDSQLTRN
jgi:hypothetical protein